MSGGTVTVAVTQPVWAGVAHGWLMPPDVVALPEDVAEQVLGQDPKATIDTPASEVAPVKRGPGRPRKTPVQE
jgi:hypothetical protein